MVLAAFAGGAVARGASTAPAPARFYEGNGTKILRPIVLRHWARVRFWDAGGLFMLIALKAPATTGPNPQLIVSRAHRGTGNLPPGRYVLKVGAFGAWQMVIR